MTTGSSKSISGELITCVRTQRIVSRSKALRRGAKLSNLEILHAKGLHHAVAGHSFLQNLIQFAELGLAAFQRSVGSSVPACQWARPPAVEKYRSPESSSSPRR